MTTLSTFYRYKFDSSGLSPTNTVLGEKIVINTPRPVPIPLHEGMFYNSSSFEPKIIISVVETGDVLIEGTDYTLIGLDHLIYARTGIEAYAAFLLKNENFTGTLSTTYQAVGGVEGIATSFVKELTEAINAAGNGAKINWAEIENKPTVFPPMEHEQPLASLTGFEAFADSLNILADTLVARVPLGGSAAGMSETLSRLTKMQAELYNSLSEVSMLSAGLVEYDDLIVRINQINLDIAEVIAQEAMDVENILELIADIRASLSSDVEGNVSFLEGINDRLDEIIAAAALEKTTTASARNALSLRISTANDLFSAEKIATSTARALLSKAITDNLELFSLEKTNTAIARTALAKSISDNLALFNAEKNATAIARSTISSTVTNNHNLFLAEKIASATERGLLNDKIVDNTTKLNTEISTSATARGVLDEKISASVSAFNTEKAKNKSEHDAFTLSINNILLGIDGLDSIFLAVDGTAENSGKLSGQAASYYLSASNLNSGTVPTARLPATITSNTSGNAATATKLAGTVAIALGGDLSGSSNFNGSAGITISATVKDDSHTHDGRYYTESEVDSKFVSVAALDGFNNNGRHDNYSGDLNSILRNSTYNISAGNVTNAPGGIGAWAFVKTMMYSGATSHGTQLCYSMTSGDGEIYMRLRVSSSWGNWVSVGITPSIALSGDAVGSAAPNDNGTFSISVTVKDSEKLSGQDIAYYRNAGNLNAGTISDARLPASISSNITGNAATATDAERLDGKDSTYFAVSSTTNNSAGMHNPNLTERFSGDIDTIVENSEYILDSGEGKLPAGLGTSWCRLVTKMFHTGSGYRIQTLEPCSRTDKVGLMWTRQRLNSSTWTDWVTVSSRRDYVPLFVPASAYGSGSITLSQPLDDFQTVLFMISSDSNRSLGAYFVDVAAIKEKDTANSQTFLVGGWANINWTLYIDEIGDKTMRQADQNSAICGVYGVV